MAKITQAKRDAIDTALAGFIEAYAEVQRRANIEDSEVKTLLDDPADDLKEAIDA